MRVLEIPLAPGANPFELKRVGGGVLVQTPDVRNVTLPELRVVTERAPSAQRNVRPAVCLARGQFVKSNAIVFCKDGQTAGIGAGQMSQVDSTRIAAAQGG